EVKSIWIIAGEASGDDYGARLAEALLHRQPDLQLKGMGSEQMRKAGVDTVIDASELGIVGLLEVFRHLPMFIRLFRSLIEQIKQDQPAAVVLIDYPGFNIRLAKRLHQLKIPVVYYISPQVWAWKKGRIPKIAASVSRMLCIFPFEPAVYAGTGMPAEFVGHPLLQILASYREKPSPRQDHLVLLLPGSRSGELHRLLPVLLQTALRLHRQRPELRFEIPLPRERSLQLARKIIDSQALPEDFPVLEFSVGRTRERMNVAAAGIAASGTVTVEAAILGLPLVVIYKVNWLTWQIAKRLVKLPFITIANLVTGKCVYEEFLQYDAEPQKLCQALLNILPGGLRHEDVRKGIDQTVAMLGGNSKVSDTVADRVLQEAKNRE
ncbi:MAG: lipid-A-disaccharide synthase, partial [Lentisphaeria bacterium]